MHIEDFIARVRRRLNLGRLLGIVLYVLGAASGVSVLYALFYIFRGYAAPHDGFFVIFAVSILLAIIWYARSRYSIEASARYSDEHFHLKDGVITGYHLEKKTEHGEVDALIRSQVETSLGHLDPQSISLSISRRRAGYSLAGLIAVFILACVPPSAKVLAAEAKEQATEARVSAALEYLKDTMESLEETLSEAELRELKLDALKASLADLEVTGDPLEAMREMARFEQKVSEEIASLDQAADEESLRKAAEKLHESEDPEARQLAKELAQKAYESAAKSLEGLKPESGAPSSESDSSAARLSELSKQAKDLARLRAVSKRMAQAQEGANRETNPEPSSMASQLSELDQNAAEMEGLLQKAKLNPDAVPMSECEACMGGVQGSIDQLAASLRRMAARKLLAQKMTAFRRELNQAQSFAGGQLAGLGQMPGASPTPGAGAGSGSVNSFQDPVASNTDLGQMTQIQGQKGEGPSSTITQDAASGTGVMTRAETVSDRAYSRQFEAFVRRDDIPLPVKSAVGSYFENIHNQNANLDIEPSVSDEPITN